MNDDKLRKLLERDLHREYLEAQLSDAIEIIKQVAAFERTDQLKGHDIMAACNKFLNPLIFKEDNFNDIS